MRKFSFILGLVAAVFLTASCTIGLGSSVDTEAPQVAFTSPESGAVIRDKFGIFGTWDDDGKIKSVTAHFQALSYGSSDVSDFTAELEEQTGSKEDGTTGVWSIEVDPSSETNPLKDGTYEVSITVEDNGGHKSKITRQYVIDNTAPVIVLQRPGTDSTVDITSADSYGQSFTLEGMGADDNNIDHINVNIYSDPDRLNLVHTVTLNNVPPTIQLDVAKFGEEDYTAIYGSTEKEGAKQFYCSIEAYDDAQRYPADGSNQSAEDTKGNYTTSYYLYDDISASILSTYKITDVYHMLSGVYESTSERASTDIIDAVRTNLNKKVQSVGSFSLNPTNNPTFVVNGKDTLKATGLNLATDDNYAITNNSDVIVEVSPGLDSTPIVNDDDFKVYVIECSSNGTAVADAEKIYPTQNSKTKSGSNYKFSVALSNTCGLTVGKTYIFGVDGQDEAGNAIMPANNGYGFYLAASGNAPDLKVEEPSSSMIYVAKDGSFSIKGYSIVDTGSPVIKILYGEEVWKSVTFEESDKDKSYKGEKNKFNFDISFDNDFIKEQADLDVNGDPVSTEFTLTVQASQSGNNSIVYKTVMYDVDGPLLSINNDGKVSPNVDTYPNAAGASKNTSGLYYSNGQISVTGNIVDDFSSVSEYSWYVIQDNVTVDGIGGTVTKSSKINISFDSTQLQDQKITTVVIKATDSAGNETIENKKFFLDQSTDKPTFAALDGTSWLEGIYNPEYISLHLNDTYRTNVISTGNNLLASVTDDDGLASVDVKVEAVNSMGIGDDGYATSAKRYTINDEGTAALTADVRSKTYDKSGLEASVSHQMPSTAGFYLVTLTVYDELYDSTKTAAENASHYTTGSFIIKISGTAPEVTITRDTKYVKTDGDNSATIAVNLSLYGEPNYTVVRKLYQEGAYSSTTIATNQPYTDETDRITAILVDEFYIKDHDFTKPVIYSVTDKSGGQADKEVSYIIDNAAPSELTITSPSSDTSATANNSYSGSDITFRGTAKDDAAGMKKILYAFTDSSVTTAPAASAYTEFASSDLKWNFNVTIASNSAEADGKTSLAEGNYKLWVIGEDAAGNKKAAVGRVFSIDQAAPVISDVKLNDTTVLKSGTNYFKTASGNFTLTGKVSDTHGISSLTVGGETVSVNSDGTWSKTIAREENKEITKAISVTDLAARTTTVNYTIYCDTTAPTGGISSPDVNLNGASSLSGSSYTFRGNADDSASGVSVMKYLITQNVISDITASATASNAETAGWVTTDSKSNFSATMPMKEGTTPEAGKLHEGKWYIYFYAADAVGNIKTDSKYFWIDQNAPVLKLADITTPTNAAVTLKATTLSDANGIAKVTVDVDGTKTEYTNTDDITTGITYTVTAADVATPDLSDDSHTITVTAEDTAGKQTSVAKTFLVDTTKPTSSETIITTAAGDGRWYATKTLSISSKVVENDSGIASVVADAYTLADTEYATQIDHVEMSKYQESYIGNLSFKDAADGKYVIIITATDLAGNVNSFTISDANIDTGAPSLSDVKLGDTPLTAGNTEYYSSSAANVTIKGKVTEELSGYQSLSIKADWTDAANTAQTKTVNTTVTDWEPSSTAKDWSIEVPATQNVAVTITVNVADKAGNKDTKTYTIYNDTEAPTVEISSPESDSSGSNSLSGTKYTFAASGDDNGGTGVASMRYLFTQTAIRPTVNPDKLNNESDTAYAERVKQSIISSATATGALDTWKEISKSNFTVSRYLSKGTDYLAEGKWYFYVYAVDQSGNKTAAERFFWIDNNAPTLKINNDKLTTKDSFTIKGSAISNSVTVCAWDANGLSKVSFSDGTTTTNYTNETTTTLTTFITNLTNTGLTYYVGSSTNTPKLNDGSYTFTITATDNAERETTVTKEVLVDTTAPAFTSGETEVTTTKATGGAYNAKSLSVSSKLEETGSGIASVVAKAYKTTDTTKTTVISETSLSLNGSAYTGNLTFTDDGKYDIVITAKDNAENSNSSTISSVIVDTTKPEFNLDSITTPTNASVVIKGSVTEENLSAITIKADNGSETDIISSLASGITYTTATLGDGSHTFVLTATDKAGNTNSVTKTVVVDTTAPSKISISSPSSNTSATGDSSYSGSDITFRGTAADNSSGMKTLYYAFTTSDVTTAPTSYTSQTQGEGNWNINVSIVSSDADNKTTLAEGKYKLWVKAEDAAGNSTAAISRVFYIDQDAPAISDVKLNSTTALTKNSVYYFNTASGDFTITGKVKDSHGISSLTVGGTTINPGTDGKWTKTITRAVNSEISTAVVATDKAGRVTTETYKIFCDTNAPTASITNPDSDLSGTDSLSGDSYTFRGSVDDTGSGIAEYRYAFLDPEITDADNSGSTANEIVSAATASDAESKGWTVLTTGSGLVLTKTLKAVGDTAADLAEGKHYLYIYAKDNAGNTATDARSYWVDLSDPSLTVDDVTTPTKASVKISGKASDTNSLSSVTVKVDSNDAKTLTVASDTGKFSKTYTNELTKATGGTADLADGSHTFVITATDAAGKTTQVTKTVLVDTTAPKGSAEITTSATSVTTGEGASAVTTKWYKSRTLGLKVSGITEDGSGISSVVANAYLGDATTASTSADLYKQTDGTYQGTITLTEDGNYNIKITMKDIVGNETTLTVTAKVDSTLPVIALDDEVNTPTNASVTIGAAVNETNISSVKLSVDGGTEEELTLSSGKYSKTYKNDLTKATGDTSVLADGSHTFKVTATDIAGNSSSVSKTIVVDTKAPTGTASIETSSTGTNSDGLGLYNTETIKVKVTGLSDANGAVATAGIDTVEAVILADGTSLTSSTQLQGLSKRGSGDSVYYEGNLQIAAQGKNNIYIVITDKAGNKGYVGSSGTTTKYSPIFVDTYAPSTFNVYETAGNTSEITGTKLINGKTEFVLYIKAADYGVDGTNSGINSITYNYGTSGIITPAAADSNGYRKLTIPANTDSKTYQEKGSAKFTVTDKAGNTATYTPFTFDIDNTAPEVSISEVTDALSSDNGDITSNVDINGSFVLKGTASDGNKVSSVVLKYFVGTTAPTAAQWTAGKVSTDGDIKSATVTGTTSWSATIDTTTLTDKKNLYVKAIATDSSGNEGYTAGTGDDKVTAEATYYINQDSDRPIITFNNLDLSTPSDIWLTGVSTINGIITDDDGITSLKYKDVAGKTATEISSMGWTAITVSSGSWKIANVSDGSHEYYFQVVDKAGKTFATDMTQTTTGGVTTYASTAAQPKLKSEATNESGDTTTSWVGNGTTGNVEVSFKVDKTSPKYVNSSVKYQSVDTSDTPSAWATDPAALEFGGIYKKFNFELDAFDENGVDSMTVTFNGNTKEGVIQTTADEVTAAGSLSAAQETAKLAGVSEATARTWLFSDIAIASDLNGTQKLSIVITDKAGLTKEDSFTISVDNTAPEISFSNYNDGDTVFATSEVNVRGTETTGSLENWYYLITNDTTDQAKSAITKTLKAGTNAGSSFSVVFDTEGTSSTEIKDKSLFDYICALESKTTEQLQASDTTRVLYMWVWGKDAAGNESDPVSLKLNVIPNGDKPSVKFTYPSKDGDKLGGTIRLTGTSEIKTSSVGGIYLQIDPSPNATTHTLTDNWETNLTSAVTAKNGTMAKLYSGLTSVTVGSTTYRGIKASGNVTSWNLTINQAEELNSSTYVAIRAFAVNAAGTKMSEIQNTYFEIDVNAPTIGSKHQLELVQFAAGHIGAINSTTNYFDSQYITARQDYEADMWIKDQWYLIGDAYDGSGIKQITYRDNNSSDPTKYLVEVTNSTNNIGAVNTTIDSATASENAPYYLNGETKGWYAISFGDAKSVELVDDLGSKLYEEDGITQKTANNYNYLLCIPVGNVTGAYGNLSYTIVATEATGQNLSASQTISLKYDNTPPEFAMTDSTVKGSTVTTKTAKFAQELDKNTAVEIVQDSGTYTMYGVFDEASTVESATQSGFSKIAFSYTRTVGGKSYVIDPMMPNDEDVSGTAVTDGRGNFIEINATNFDVTVSGSIITNNHSDGLYWYKYTGATITNNNTITLATAPNKHIRQGGLAKINGVYYVIESSDKNAVDYTNKTVKINGSLQNTTGVTVYFAAAQVIDHVTNEKQTTAAYNYATTGTGVFDYENNVDDGDQMNETITSSGTLYTWTAGIDSSLILDGTVNINFTAFDAAGNLTTKTYTGKVKNNAPRLYGVKFGTDASGNDELEDSEWITTYSQQYKVLTDDKNTDDTSDDVYEYGYERNVTIPKYTISIPISERLTIKGLTKVKPEIVGGNVGLGYTYTYKKDITDTTEQTTDYEDYSGTSHSGDGQPRTDDLTITLSVLDFLKLPIGDGDQTLTFKVWDNTDGTTFGTNSYVASVELPVNVSIRDEENPQVYFKPFHWNSSSDNSLYNNSTKYGHIELENDLPSTFTAGGTGEMDRDPKISGTVGFDGVATDNVVVKKIMVSIPRYDPDGTGTAAEGSEFVIATRKTDGDWESDYPITSTKTAMTSDWAFQLVSDTYASDGKNTVKFKLYFNTEKISTVALSNASIVFGAEDRGSASLNAAKTAYKYSANAASDATVVEKCTWSDVKADTTTTYYTTNTSGTLTNAATSTTASSATVYASRSSTYRVDVVPYITGVSTALGTANATKLQARTALGHYPVSSTETITFSGFNLTGAKYVQVEADSTNNVAETLVSLSDSSLSASNILASGSLRLKVGSVYTLNNINNDDAAGGSGKTISKANITSETISSKDLENYAYNRKPNSNINLHLNDDVIFDVWTLNSKAALPESNGMITEPVMRINPTTGGIGFAFANGPAYFSMANGNMDKIHNRGQYWDWGTSRPDLSYACWQRNYDDFAGVDFVYDSAGNTHGLVVGRDVESNVMLGGRFTYVTSKWDNGDLSSSSDNYDSTNKVRMETIGLPAGVVVSGTALTSPVLDKTRIRCPTMAVANSITYTENNTSKTAQTVYMAFFDNLQQQIRFRWARSSDTKDNTVASDDTRDTRGQLREHDGNANSTYDYKKGVIETPSYEYSVVAGVDYEVQSFTYSHNTTNADATPGTAGTYYGYDTGNKAGEYLSLGVIENTTTTAADDVVVLVWYDGTDTYYSYKVNPCNDHDAGNTGTNANKAGTNGYWSTPIRVFSNAGEYCKVAVGKDNSIHIAATTVDAKLVYGYMSSYNNIANLKTSTIDSNGLTGTYIGLDTVVSENGHVIPYISYYMQSMAKTKVAYLVDTSTSVDYDAEGADSSGIFSGNWEISLVPTSSKICQDNTNIGFYKYKSGATIDGGTTTVATSNIGKARIIPSGTSTAQDNALTSSTTTSYYGKTYGNGTKNPVVAYAIKATGTSGAIETAQMR